MRRHRLYSLVFIVIGAIYVITWNGIVPAETLDIRCYYTAWIFIIMSALLLLVPKFSMDTYAALYSTVYGICVIIISSTTVNDPQLVTMVSSMSNVLFGFILVMVGILLYVGEIYNVYRMRVLYIGIAIFIALPLLWSALFSDSEIVEYIFGSKNYMLMLLLLAVIMVMLYDTKIGYKSNLKKIKSDIYSIGNQKMGGKETSVFRDDLAQFLSDDSWVDVDCGPIRRQKILDLRQKNIMFQIVFSEWDDGKVRGDIVQHEKDTHVQSIRFEPTELIMDGPIETCTRVRIYGKNGYFVEIPVVNKPKEQTNTRMHRTIKFLIGYKD